LDVCSVLLVSTTQQAKGSDMAKKYSQQEIAEVILQLLDTPDEAMMQWLGIEDQYIGQGMHNLVIWNRDDLVRETELDN